MTHISLVCNLRAVSFNLLFMVLQKKKSLEWQQSARDSQGLQGTCGDCRSLPQSGLVTPTCFGPCLLIRFKNEARV